MIMTLYVMFIVAFVGFAASFYTMSVLIHGLMTAFHVLPFLGVVFLGIVALGCYLLLSVISDVHNEIVNQEMS